MNLKTNEFIKLLEKHQAGLTSPEEDLLVQKYFKAKLKDSASVLSSSSDAAKDRVNTRLQSSLFGANRQKPIFRIPPVWAVAASIALLFGLFMVFNGSSDPENQWVQTEYGQKKEIILPDGSKVLLNSGSRIEFPAYFKGEKREVSLVGEAFFDVHRDTLHPFIISTEGVKTQVLGTSFNVNAFPENDSISVSVATGKVRVSDQKGVNEILLPDQQLHYHKNTHAFRKAQKNAIVDRAWTLNTIHLDNKTVKEAVQIIERWFNIKIEIPDGDLAHRKIMGKYQNPELQQTFESLSFLLQARFEEITPETYRIVP
ncbi:MAG: hypothetical protein CML05_03660 [Pseudozobellia sp.]|nr:hypothetical protein [Pseudozobellia sp.]